VDKSLKARSDMSMMLGCFHG